MSTVRFSVLMSVYHGDNEVFLKEALISIYDEQVLKPSEIILVCDGPLNDKLDGVIGDFIITHPDLVKLIRISQNVGLGNALHIGAQSCSCDIICRMDADDISDPMRFHKQILYLDEHPDVSVVGSNIAEFSSVTKKIEQVRKVYQDHDGIVAMSRKRNPMNHVSVCMRKCALFEVGSYVDIRYLEDYYLWLRMICSGHRLANIPENLVNVRINDGFYRRRSSRDQISGWKKLQMYMLKNHLINRYNVLINMMSIYIFVYAPLILKKVIYAVLRQPESSNDIGT